MYRNEAAILAARKDRDMIEKADLEEAIRRVRLSRLSPEDRLNCYSFEIMKLNCETEVFCLC